MPSALAGRPLLFAGPAAVLALRLLSALAPADPMLFGAPFGLVAELMVVGASTVSLWIAVRILLPGAERGRPGDPASGS